MIVSAALVPGTALLVPGAAGRAEVLGAERAAARAAVADLLATAPDRVVLVIGLDADRAGPRGVFSPADTVGLAAAGIPGAGGEPAEAVGRWLLGDPGVPVATVMACSDRPAAELRARGARLAGPGRTALLAVGSLSARRGEEAPLPPDPRAAEVDDAVLAWWAGGPEVSGDLARALAVSAWAPLQVLAGAPAGPTRAEVRSVTWPFGATYAVATRLPA